MNRRRKTDLIEAKEYAQSNPIPDINRAHRECERECLDLKKLLAKCACVMAGANELCEEAGYRFDEIDNLTLEIEKALIPAEVKNG